MTIAESVWRGMDLLNSPDAIDGIGLGALQDTASALRWHRIEQYERPSIDGGPGATAKCLKFQREFEKHEYRIFCSAGANRSGKTITNAGLCFCKHIRDVAHNGNVFWVISQTSNTMRDIPQKMLWEFLPRSMFPDGIQYSPRMGFGLIPTLHLHLPHGRGRCEIRFMTEEQDLVIFESANVQGLMWTECTRELIFDALQPRLVDTRGWMLLDFVPVQAWHKFRLRIPAETGSKLIYHQRFSMSDNAHNLAPGAIDELRQTITAREASVRIDGEDGAEFGVVYLAFEPKHHVCPPFEIPDHWPRYRCMDYGYRNPTACLWVVIIPDTQDWSELVPDLDRPLMPRQERAVIYREYYLTGQTVPSIAGTIRAMSGDEVYRNDGLITADPTMWNLTQVTGKRATSLADEFAVSRLPLCKAARTQGIGEHAQVAKVRWWFEHDKIVMFNTCENSIREHESWRYKEDRDGHAPGNEPFVDADNHTCDAFRYLMNSETLTFHKPVASIRRMR